MQRGVPLFLKQTKYYEKFKNILPESIRDFVAGDLNKHKQNMLIASVKNEKKILPSLLTIELTNHCNAACTFCTQPDIMERTKSFITEEVLQRCVEQVKKHNISEVMLAGMGEPFMYKKIISLIKTLSDMGVSVSVTTNGSIFHVFDPSEIVESGIDYLLISMDAIDTEWLHETKPGIKKDVEQMEAEIKKIYNHKIKNNLTKPLIKLKYQILENSNNMLDKEKEKEILESKVGTLCDVIDLRQQHDWLGEANDGVGNHTLPKATMDNICSQLVKSIEISWNGDVGFCCMDYDNNVKLGNILDNDISEIYNSEHMLNARKMYLDGNAAKHNMCSGCYS